MHRSAAKSHPNRWPLLVNSLRQSIIHGVCAVDALDGVQRLVRMQCNACTYSYCAFVQSATNHAKEAAMLLVPKGAKNAAVVGLTMTKLDVWVLAVFYPIIIETVSLRLNFRYQ